MNWPTPYGPPANALAALDECQLPFAIKIGVETAAHGLLNARGGDVSTNPLSVLFNGRLRARGSDRKKEVITSAQGQHLRYGFNKLQMLRSEEYRSAVASRLCASLVLFR